MKIPENRRDRKRVWGEGCAPKTPQLKNPGKATKKYAEDVTEKELSSRHA